MTRSRTSLFLATVALLGACSDPAAPPVVPVQGAPISGAPIDGGPAAPSAPAAAAPATTAEPPIGDVSTPAERGPEDAAVTTAPAAREPSATQPVAPAATGPGAPATSTDPVPPPPGAPTSPAPASTDTALPAVTPTPAAQSDKPPLPEKAPSADAAKPAGAKPDPAKSLIPKDKKKTDPIELTWDELASFEFVAPPPVYSDPETGVFPDQTAAIEKATKQIPPEIWELEGQTISVEGYMIPLEYAEEGVRSFLISRHAMGCCFGVMPRPHELVECDMGEAKPPPYVGYLPVKVTGTLHVGLKHGPATVLSGIYRMDAPKVTVSQER